MNKLMSGRMYLIISVLICAIAAAGMTGSAALAQNLFAQEGQTIYGGRPALESGIIVGSWGSGTCKESTVNTYGGSNSLEITPKDLYAGGRIDLTVPVDLTSSFNDPYSYLQLVTRFGGAQTGFDSWTVGLSAPRSTDIYGGTATPGKHVKRIRIMLHFDGGQTLECQADVASFKLSADGWMNISFPLAALKNKLNLTEYKVNRLVITGDGTEPFYIGEIRTARDNTPLQADAGEEKELARNYPIVFHGFSESGASAVKYSWDFNADDGIQEEAVGDLVYHRFSQAGNFIITLTVSDVFGLKTPATSIANVKVNE